MVLVTIYEVQLQMLPAVGNTDMHRHRQMQIAQTADCMCRAAAEGTTQLADTPKIPQSGIVVSPAEAALWDLLCISAACMSSHNMFNIVCTQQYRTWQRKV